MNRRTLLFSIILGWIVVSITPFFDSVLITNQNDLLHHRLGFPFPIIEQKTWLTPMEDDYPFKLSLVNPQEHPTHILIVNYVFSIIITTILIHSLLLLLKQIVRKIRKI